MAAEENADVLFFFGPPCVGKSLYYYKHLMKTHERLCPDEIFEKNPDVSIRQLVNKYVVTAVKKGNKIVIDDGFQTENKRESYKSLLKKKVSNARITCYKFVPKFGEDQLYWTKQYKLAENLIKDNHNQAWDPVEIDTWLRNAETPVDDEGIEIKEIQTEIISHSLFQFEVPALLIQWEAMIHASSGDTKLVDGIPQTLELWYKNNPCGRVIVISDANSSHGVSTSDRHGLIKHLLGKLAKELTGLIIYALLESPVVSGDQYSTPPSPGFLAFLQGAHCIDFQHPGTMYMYHTQSHLKMTENIGIKHIKGSRVFSNPSLVASSHGIMRPPIPDMLRNIEVMWSHDLPSSESSPNATIPLHQHMMKSPEVITEVKVVPGRNLLAFAKDKDTINLYQEEYNKNATLSTSDQPSKIFSLHKSFKTKANTIQIASLNRSQSSLSRGLPKWMMAKDSSSKKKTPIERHSSSSLDKSLSLSSRRQLLPGDQGSSIMYVLSSEELIETAKLILNEAGVLVPTDEEIQASLDGEAQMVVTISSREPKIEKLTPNQNDDPARTKPETKKTRAESFDVFKDFLDSDGSDTNGNGIANRTDVLAPETDISQNTTSLTQTRDQNCHIQNSFVSNTASDSYRTSEVKYKVDDNDPMFDDLLLGNNDQASISQKQGIQDSYISCPRESSLSKRSGFKSESTTLGVVDDSLVPATHNKRLRLSSGMRDTVIIEDSLVPSTANRGSGNSRSYEISDMDLESFKKNSNKQLSLVPDSFVAETVKTVPETVLSEKYHTEETVVQNKKHLTLDRDKITPTANEEDISDLDDLLEGLV